MNCYLLLCNNFNDALTLIFPFFVLNLVNLRMKAMEISVTQASNDCIQSVNLFTLHCYRIRTGLTRERFVALSLPS